MTDQDKIWHELQVEHGWVLPPKAPLVMRWPVIRHVRAFFERIKVERHYAAWGSIGAIRASGYDDWVLYAIRRGWC